MPKYKSIIQQQLNGDILYTYGGFFNDPQYPPSPTPTTSITPTPTPSITPTNTITPTKTPTLTPTPTDPRDCRTYTIANNGFSCSNFNWTNCDGSSSATTLCFGASTTICAKNGSVSQDAPNGSITDIGTCPLPSPTPTNTTTPTTTPTQTPTNTPTPTTSQSIFYYDAQDCNDPFASPVVVSHTSSLLIGSAVKVLGDPNTCYEILNVGFAPIDFVVSTTYVDCVACNLTITPTPTKTPTPTPTPTNTTTPTKTPTNTPTNTITPTQTPTKTGTPTPTPTKSYSSWSVSTCSNFCSGGNTTCVGATATTLYMAPNDQPDYSGQPIYTNTSLTTQYVGYYQYAGCIFYNDGVVGIYQEGCVGDPC